MSCNFETLRRAKYQPKSPSCYILIVTKASGTTPKNCIIRYLGFTYWVMSVGSKAIRSRYFLSLKFTQNINILALIGQRSTWNECLAGDAFGECKSIKPDIPALYYMRIELFMNNLTNS